MNKKKLITLSSIIFLITLVSILPSYFNGFTNWDDQIMITQNANITSLSPANVRYFFTSFHERLYHPLVLITYAVEYHFFKLNPTPYHFTSGTLHILNTLLVFWLFIVFTDDLLVSFIISVLFGIHPMHVESFAWLAERKDVLYSFFFLLSLISYAYYLKRHNIRWHLACFGFFLLSLLSKSMAMTLPFVLFAMDIMKNRPINRKLLYEKFHFIALSVLFGIITILGHYEYGVKGREFSFSLWNNLMLMFQNIVFYLVKFVAPVKLSCIYTLPDKMQNFPQILFTLSPLIVLVLAIGVFYSLRYTKNVAFGSFFFIATIFPVLQLLPVGLAVPADRYTYISYIGLFYIFAEGFAFLFKRYNNKYGKAMIIGLFILFAVLSVFTFQRARVWKDGITIWDDVTSKYSNIPLAYYNRADEYFLKLGDMNKAMADFNKAVDIDPDYFEAYVNMGLIYYFKNEPQKAIPYYDKAEKISPQTAEIYLNRGNAYNALGSHEKALTDYRLALAIKPAQAEGWYNRGNAYLSIGQYQYAVSDYTMAIRLNQNYVDAYNNRGNAYFNMGKPDSAMIDFTQAIWLDPNYANAHFNRALVYNAKKDYVNAYKDALKAQKLGARIDPKALDNLRQLAGQ